MLRFVKLRAARGCEMSNLSEDSTPPFAMIPLEVMLDRRLTLETLRVLITLFSFRRKNTDLVFPKRDTIAQRCNMHRSNISAATSALVKLGWLTKEGVGGNGRATRYTITVPEIVAHSATVAEQTTVVQSATSTIADATTPPVAQSATHNRTEKLTEKGTEKKATSSKKLAITLKQFLEACKASGEQTIPENDPVFEYADTIGLDREMVAVCWHEFKNAFVRDDSKRQKDWRAHFRNAVRRNWYKLWYLKEDEVARWTSSGEQARRAAA